MGSHPTPSSIRENVRIHEQDLESKYPGLQSYKECILRAYGCGLASFALASSSSYFCFKALTWRVTIDKRYFFIPSALLGSLSGYYFTKERARLCHEHLLMREGQKKPDTEMIE